MIDKLVWEAFNNFKLYKNNKEIKIKELERSTIRELEHKEKGNFISIYPKDSDYILLLSIIYNALKISFFNIYKEDFDILDAINEGDIIKYDKSLCKYKEREEDKIKIQFSDGCILLPVNMRYKLSPYHGTATKLNKMPTSKSNKIKNLLAEIMGINIDEICKVGKKSILIIENKQRIYKLIRSLSIKIGDNEKVALTEVFSMAYYSSEENVYHFKGNYKKEDPIIKFTSKVYIANNLCKRIKTINSVLFLPKKLLLEDLEDLKEIERRKNISSITTVALPIDIEKQVNNEYFNEDFDIKNCLNKLESGYDINYFNNKQYLYLRNYSKELINLDLIYDKISNLRKKINIKCSFLSKLFENDDDITKYIISVRKFIKRLLSIPIPISNFDDIIKKDQYQETTTVLFKNIKTNGTLLKQGSIREEVKKCIDLIYDLSEEIYEFIQYKNPKWCKLKNIVIGSKTKSILIISDNKIIRSGITEYIKRFFPNRTNIKIEKIKDINYDNIYDKVVFTGLLEENYYNNYKIYYSNEIQCIFYKFEYDLFKFVKSKYNKFINQPDIEEVEYKYLVEDNFETEQIDIEEVTRELELENKIEEFLITGYMYKDKNLNDESQPLVKCSKVIKFSDGKRAFITKHFNAYELDEEREEIVIRKANEISVGQVLLFIDGLNKDIVESTLKGIINLPKIKDIYEKPYDRSKKWKKILKDFMKYNNFTLGDLSSIIKSKGVSRTAPTIRGWLIDSTVGPQEVEVFKALAEMTNDEYFIENYKEIFNSCNLIRSLQIKVRKAIAKKLLRIDESEDNDEIDKIIMDNCKHDFDYVIKVEVEKIFDIEKDIPAYLTNTVLEE